MLASLSVPALKHEEKISKKPFFFFTGSFFFLVAVFVPFLFSFVLSGFSYTRNPPLM